MQWIKVVLAGFVEVFWVTGLKYADHLFEYILALMFICLSFYLVISACRTLPVGTVYAAFVGLGTVGTVITEIIFFNEPFSWLKVSLILLLIIGVIGLKLTSDVEEGDER